MAFSSLAGLRDAGAPVGQLSEAQQAVPADLTPPEAGALTSAGRRSADAAPGIEGRPGDGNRHFLAGGPRPF